MSITFALTPAEEDAAAAEHEDGAHDIPREYPYCTACVDILDNAVDSALEWLEV